MTERERGLRYVLVGIWFEERDLVAQFGQRYRDYRRHVGMLLPTGSLRDDGDPARSARLSEKLHERPPADLWR